MKTVIASLFGNPLHAGHVRYLTEARKLGDFLVVIVNTDAQVAIKGSVPFMNENERLEIIQALKPVDHAILAIDKDGTVAATLAHIFQTDPNGEFIFAKGGDRSSAAQMPSGELNICTEANCQIVYGVGGFEKVQSSSKLISEAKEAKKL